MDTMKSKLHWLIYDKDSPLTDHSLTFGCRIKTSKWSFNNPVEIISHTHHGDLMEWECSGRGNRVLIGRGDIQEILGHPIHLHHVLAAGEEKVDYIAYRQVLKLLELWRDCGKPGDNAFTKSLQEIFFGDGVEWATEVVARVSIDLKNMAMEGPELEENELIPTDPAVKALGELLIQLFTGGDMN